MIDYSGLASLMKASKEQKEKEEAEIKAQEAPMSIEGLLNAAKGADVVDQLTSAPEAPEQYMTPMSQEQASQSVQKQVLKAADAEDADRERKNLLLTGSEDGNENDKETPLGKYEQLLADYETKRKEAGGKDLMVQGVQSLMDAFSQYDLAGGGQFAGLKAKKTKVPELGFGKQVENQFNKQLQLEGLKRKEKELDIKRKAAMKKASETLTKPTKGQEARDKAFAKDYAEFANAGGYASVRKNLQTLEDVKAKLQGSELTGGLVEKLAPEGVRDAYRRAFEEEAQDVKDQIEQVIQQSLRQTLGAQFTEKEAARLIERSYNTALSPEKNVERLDRTIQELDAMARAKEQSGRYFEKFGTLTGYESPLGGYESKKEAPGTSRKEGDTWEDDQFKYKMQNGRILRKKK